MSPLIVLIEMNEKNDFSFREQRIRDHLVQHGKSTSISNLDFGSLRFKSLAEIKTAQETGEIEIAFDSAPETAEAVLPKREWYISLFLGWLPAIFALIYIFSTIYFKDFWILIGIAFLLLGHLETSPFKKPIVGAFLWIPMVYLFFSTPTWGWILLGYYLAYIPAGYVRHLIQMNIEDACNRSEVFFAYFYQKGKLLMRLKGSPHIISG